MVVSKLARWAVGLALAAGVALVSMAGPASAHGEKSQQAFLRMRTLNWYDVKWSKREVNVNDTFEITGKIHFFSGWPQAVAKPEVAFLNVGEPGPVAVRLESFIGDQFVPRSVAFNVGDDYNFRIVLKARREGRWHIHPTCGVQGGGPIVGPGEWITIKGSMDSFTNPTTLVTGETIDLETYGIASVWAWHIFWFVFGVGWIMYWFLRRGFLGSYFALESGREIITQRDKTIGAAALGVTLLIVIYGYASAQASYPRTLPLQAGKLIIHPMELPAPTLAVKVLGGRYKVPGRELDFNIKITNNGKEAVRAGQFTTAGLVFLNPEVFTGKYEYPEYALADRGLSVSDPKPLAPGETREMTVKVQDAIWDVQRLSDLAYDTDSQFGGLLMFYSDSGNREVVEVGGPVVPEFVSQ
jgi:methane/ammonia monooxygenase subunit B